VNDPSITLVVETSKGTFLRPIRPATILPEGLPPGYAAEDATRSAAAYWGLPDFVFRPAVRARGSASREVGDAILVVGTVGASIQVKARYAAATHSEARERLWLDKKIHHAARQAQGTIRNLKSSAHATLVNERGRQVVIKGNEKTWLLVTVLDHPRVEGYIPAGPAVVLLRQDWEFLFEQLKSTYAVMEYLRRVSGEDPVPLGDEAVRYYKLAAADAAALPSPIDPRLLQFMHKSGSAPLLPQAPAGHGDDPHHFLVRAVLEDIATSRLPEGTQQADLLDLLAAIDATPVAYRAELGKMWLSWLREVANAPSSSITWRFRGHIWTDRPYLIFGAAPRHDALIQEAFGKYVSLRHQQHLEAMPERAEMLTVGVVLTPRGDGLRPWDTTAIATQGNQAFEDDERPALERLWGQIGESVVHTDAEIPDHA
jgi:hypothetical protein